MSWTWRCWTRRPDGSFDLPLSLVGQLMADQRGVGRRAAGAGGSRAPRHPLAPRPPAPEPARLFAPSRRDHDLPAISPRGRTRAGGDRGRGR